MLDEYFENLKRPENAKAGNELEELIVKETIFQFEKEIASGRHKEAGDLLCNASKVSAYEESLNYYGGAVLSILSSDYKSTEQFLKGLTSAPEIMHPILENLSSGLAQRGRLDLAIELDGQLAKNFPLSQGLAVKHNSLASGFDHYQHHTSEIAAILSKYPESEMKDRLNQILPFMLTGNFLTAQNLLQDLLRHYTNEPLGLYALAITLLSRSNFRLAGELLKIVVSIKSELVSARLLQIELQLAESDVYTSAEMSEIIGQLTEICQIDPQNTKAAEILGWARMWDGDYWGGLTALRCAREKINRTVVTNKETNSGRVYLHPNWLLSFGHLWVFEVLAKCKALGIAPDARYSIIARHKITNRALCEYYSDVIEIISEPNSVKEALPHTRTGYWEPPYVSLASGRQSIALRPLAELDNLWNKKVGRPLLTIHPTHEQLGDNQLKRLGVPEGSWFVTMHIRESTKYYGEDFHSMHEFRNAQLNNYFKVFDYIANLGGYVIRIGDTTMSKLPHFPNVIDYVHSSFRTDWMDIYLLAKCRFLVGMSSGPNVVPSAFGVPVAYTNVTPLIHPFVCTVERDLAIPKLYWLERESRFATFEESMTFPIVAQMHSGPKLRKMGIIPVENSADEILELVKEMVSRLENKQTLSQEALSLHARLNNQLPAELQNHQSQILGTHFLETYQHLLKPAVTANSQARSV